MALGLLDRSAGTDTAAGTVTPAPEAGGRFAAVRQRLAIQRLGVRRLAIRTDPLERERERLRQLVGARVLLERARALVADGWVQDAFYVVRDGRGEQRPVSPFGLLLLSRGDVVGACLVGAVAHATSTVDRHERRGHAALAVDTLWEALAETDGRLADSDHPAARAARVRELARWNDEPERSRQEVLGLLDRAVSRTILGSVR